MQPHDPSHGPPRNETEPNVQDTSPSKPMKQRRSSILTVETEMEKREIEIQERDTKHDALRKLLLKHHPKVNIHTRYERVGGKGRYVCVSVCVED